MEQAKPREEIDVRDHPPLSGIVLNEERNKIIFEDGSSSTPRQDSSWFDGEAKMILLYFGRFLLLSSRGTPSQTVRADWRITPYSTENTLTLPELPTRRWMWCPRNILTITGMLMEIDNCRMHGQVSQECIDWKNRRMDGHGSGEDWRENRRPQGQTKHGQNCGNMCLTRGQEDVQNPTQRRILKKGWKMHTLAGWWLELRGTCRDK